MPSIRCGTGERAIAPRTGSATAEDGSASTSAAVAPGIHQPLQGSFRLTQRGMDPLGLLP
ncbi:MULTISPECIES: hypothetical protein [unclassified Streptomyces]|uniref:hypothetical protein n=1 Tax=unclassified Streptomyces TaxID=2593676 RepID=UPI0004BD541A|nr:MULTISPECIES: hypothetical protein [unclassified Streptomyces]KOV74049.1 hypothetical protein ADL02_38265 [Streptomyces sp. NRRL WC-3723]